MICQNCGAVMADDSRFCVTCGAPVNTPVNPPKKKKKGPLLGLLIAFVIIVPVFILGWWVVEKIRDKVQEVKENFSFVDFGKLDDKALEYEGENVAATRDGVLLIDDEAPVFYAEKTS